MLQDPTLDELLDEPIVRLLMQRDGITADSVRRLMHALQDQDHNAIR